jgi:hypothetical protein
MRCADSPITSEVPSVITAGATQFVCAGWTGGGSVPATGSSNSVAFILANDSTIRWLWQTNYWVDAARIGGGDVETSSTWRAAGSVLTLSAAPRPGHSFLGWRGDTGGCVSATTTLDIPIDGRRSVWAEFTASAIAYTPSHVHLTGAVHTAGAVEDALTISNAGAGILSYTLRPDSFWLSAAPPTGDVASAASAPHTVRAALRGLDRRTYRGSVFVSDPYASNSPVEVPVTLVITSRAPPASAVAWGSDSMGQSGMPLGWSNMVAISAGHSHSLALREDGTVLACGDATWGAASVPADVTNAIAIAAGQDYSVAALGDGRLRTWGRVARDPYAWPESPPDEHGIIIIVIGGVPAYLDPPSDVTNAMAVAAGTYHALALLENGEIRGWGDNDSGQTNVPPDATNAVAIAAGDRHSAALLRDGGLRMWGQTVYGQIEPPTNLGTAVAIAAGDRHTLALQADGVVRAWGLNSSGQCSVPAGATGVVAVAAGGSHSLALLEDGTVLAWGLDDAGQATPPGGLQEAFLIAGGDAHSMAVCRGEVHPLVVTSAPAASTSVRTLGIVHGFQTTFRVPTTITSVTTQFICTGWTGGGAVPAAGTSNALTFTMSGDGTLAWLWRTNFQVAFETSGRGNITGATNGWYAIGSYLTATGMPDVWHHLAGWSGDVASGQGATPAIALAIDQPRVLTAAFEPNLAPRGTPEHWIAAHGLTNQPFDLAEMDDRDGDGRPAWEEFTADTDPTNAASVLEISSLSFLGDVLAIGIRGGTGAAICVEVSTNMVAAAQDWIPVAQLLPPMPPTNTCYAPAFTPLPIIYRVRAWRP